jgi:arylsulfatase A-like enzyme
MRFKMLTVTKWIGLCLAIGFFFTFQCSAQDKPNVLLIVADDLGWSDVGWHAGFSKTPTLDRLVREGVELDRHHVQPVCTPTRTALMSGRYPGRFGPQALAPSNLRAIPLGTLTLASFLKSHGYRTHLSGKWHLGARPEWIPNSYGFDSSYGTLTGAADPWTHKYRAGNPYEDTWHRDGKLFQEEGNATELVAAEAVRRIEQADGPWFVYVPFHAVHTPVDAPQQFKDLYRDISFSPDPIKNESRLRMAAMVSQLDAKVAELVQAVERKGELDNTLVIFTSDNGGIESLKNAYVGTVPDSPLNSENDPLRGQKNTLYEGGTRVCAFAYWPGKLKPHRSASPMHCVDWLPTIAEILGVPNDPKWNWDGVSRWQTLSSGEFAERERPIYISKGAAKSLYWQGWKIIVRENGKAELFHINEDPFEKKDLANKETNKLMELQRLLAEQKKLDLEKMPEDLKGLPH